MQTHTHTHTHTCTSVLKMPSLLRTFSVLPRPSLAPFLLFLLLPSPPLSLHRTVVLTGTTHWRRKHWRCVARHAMATLQYHFSLLSTATATSLCIAPFPGVTRQAPWVCGVGEMCCWLPQEFKRLSSEYLQ